MGKGDYLGMLEQQVLTVLERYGGDPNGAYGVTIRHEIHERTGRDVSYGALYTTLERLEKKGFVSSRWGEPTRERGGKAKRYFKIEAEGHLALNRSRIAMDRLRAGPAPVKA